MNIQVAIELNVPPDYFCLDYRDKAQARASQLGWP
jgi:hypothetical protein